MTQQQSVVVRERLGEGVMVPTRQAVEEMMRPRQVEVMAVAVVVEAVIEQQLAEGRATHLVVVAMLHLLQAGVVIMRVEGMAM